MWVCAQCSGPARAVDPPAVSLTRIAVQGTLTNPDGSAASGQFVATPAASLINGQDVASPGPQAGVIDPSGRIVAQSLEALVINATDDDGTSPTGTAYTFSIKIDGAGIVEFTAAVPNDSIATETMGITSDGVNVVMLTTLVAWPSMIDRPISGTNIPAAATVTDVDTLTNTVTISADATATTIGCTFEIGGAVDLTTLIDNAL